MVFYECYETGAVNISIKLTFIILIPKKVRYLEVRNYRPISIFNKISVKVHSCSLGDSFLGYF